MLRLTASDGHPLDAYLARPAGTPRGGIVIAQEMYGITEYLTSVCDFYAAHGYLAIAPALYDRKQHNLVLSYDEGPDHDRAQNLFNNWDWNAALVDLDAARAAVAYAGRVGIVGFCFGGSLTWLAACRYSYACAVAYYGSDMPRYRDENPRCPVIAHVGDKDKSFPSDQVAAFRARHPEVTFHIHADAPHGFDNPSRPARHQPEACRIARGQTLAFLEQHIG
jgi:carboxymethylenebutenolidase